MSKNFPVDKFENLRTPFYYYNMQLLEETLKEVAYCADLYDFDIHYAIKANANSELLKTIKKYNFGVDCVSGYEIERALSLGFSPEGIVYAGVGKADWEIELGIDNNISCFNVESVVEMKIINQIAKEKNKVVNIAVRINPNVDADTHAYITTGLDDNKFGINQIELDRVIRNLKKLSNLNLYGLHFHIGSQILNLNSFVELTEKVNEIQDWFENQGFNPEIVNVGGGLGIDYDNPDENPIPNFREYFKIFNENLKLRDGQKVHFELGRSIVGQCGTLITQALYVKQGTTKQFAIVDAGMTELIRPALYGAYHKIENLSNSESIEKYDIVGPICESSDTFGVDVELPKISRGDYIAIRSAGAYGEVMASQYNLRKLPESYFSDKI